MVNKNRLKLSKVIIPKTRFPKKRSAAILLRAQPLKETPR